MFRALTFAPHLSVAVVCCAALGCSGKAFWDPWSGGAGGQAPVGYGGAAVGGGQTTVNGSSRASSGTAVGGAGSMATGPGGGGTGAGLPGEAGLTEQFLGTVSAADPKSFSVPPGTLGVGVVVRPPGAFSTFGVESLVAPNQQSVIANYSLDGTSWVYGWFGITVAGVPQSDAASAMPNVMNGTWTVTLGDPYGNGTNGDLSIWFRHTDDGMFHGGALDLNVFIAEGAGSEIYVDTYLRAAFDGYAGLEVGAVEFFELGPQWAVLDETTDLLLVVEKTSIATRAPALNVIVVADLTGELESAAGVAAGIPGFGVEHGTHASGIVVELHGDPQLDALVARHEGGHLAGLFHTTEIDPGYFDSLSDTLKCTDVEGLMFDCPDATNIMFPVAGTLANELSVMQERVIHGSTLYRGFANAAEASQARAALQPGSPARYSAKAKGVHGLASASPLSSTTKLSPSAAQLLASHWCARGVDHYALLKAMGVGPAELLSLGQDRALPDFVRKRALRGVARMAPGHKGARKVAQTLAQDVLQPRAVRLGALRVLEGRAVLSTFSHDPDPVVASLARRLR